MARLPPASVWALVHTEVGVPLPTPPDTFCPKASPESPENCSFTNHRASNSSPQVTALGARIGPLYACYYIPELIRFGPLHPG